MFPGVGGWVGGAVGVGAFWVDPLTVDSHPLHLPSSPSHKISRRQTLPMEKEKKNTELHCDCMQHQHMLLHSLKFSWSGKEEHSMPATCLWHAGRHPQAFSPEQEEAPPLCIFIIIYNYLGGNRLEEAVGQGQGLGRDFGMEMGGGGRGLFCTWQGGHSMAPG